MATTTPMRLSTGEQLDCPPRFGTPRNPERRTLGHEVAEIASRLGRPLMPWQQHVVDVALEIDDDGNLVYSEVNLAVMRQQGKTSLILPVLVHRCRVMAKAYGKAQNVVYTAQDGNHARSKWESDQVRALERSPYGPLGKGRLPGKHATVRLSNGSEGILWNNGSTHRPVAPTETAGHGDTIDVAVLDEAFAQVDDRVEQAFDPAMLTRRSPQLWVTSAAGTDRSVYWWAKVQRGRQLVESGTDSPVCYFEWSIADDEDHRDREVWRRRLPALGHTVTEERLAATLAKIEAGEGVDADDEGAGDQGIERFLRPYMGRWCRFPKGSKGASVIDAAAWHACRDGESEPTDPVSFGIAIAPDRSHAAIGVAGTNRTGSSHVELVDARFGTDWVLDRVLELWNRWNPAGVAVEAAGAAGALVPALERAGVRVVEVQPRQMARACGDLLDAVTASSLRHLGQDGLTAAALAAGKRSLGDLWVWDQRAAAVDITPLVAITAARWIAADIPAPEPPRPVFAY
jgi:hypothetical protein